ncbi:MAG: hypothetical protein V2A34_04535 [Lentisphaerota bacterium]
MIRTNSGKRPFNYPLPGILPMLVIGCLLGYIFAGDLFIEPRARLIIAFAWGFVCSCLFLNWVDVIGQLYSLSTNPIPEELDLADRGQIKVYADGIKSSQPLMVRMRNLLETWAQSSAGGPVMALAAFQSSRWRHVMISEFVFCFILLLFTLFQGCNSTLVWAGIAALALTVVIRQSVNDKVDQYVENRLLARLPGNLPQTAMTAGELAGALGVQIEKAFRDYIPQPEQLAAALKAGAEECNQAVIREIKDLHKVLLESQTVVVQTWTEASRTTTTELRDVEKALATVVADLTGGLKANAANLGEVLIHHTQGLKAALMDAGEQIKKSQAGGATQLQEVLSNYATMLNQSSGTWSSQLKTVLSEHVATLDTATQSLAGQLQKITELAAGIEQVLHVQRTVDDAVRSMSGSEDFKQTLETLRKHLEASDDLLREAAKPRVIRLVETEGDVREM